MTGDRDGAYRWLRAEDVWCLMFYGWCGRRKAFVRKKADGWRLMDDEWTKADGLRQKAEVTCTLHFLRLTSHTLLKKCAPCAPFGINLLNVCLLRGACCAKTHAPNVPLRCPLDIFHFCVWANTNGCLGHCEWLFRRTRTVVWAYANGSSPYPFSL